MKLIKIKLTHVRSTQFVGVHRNSSIQHIIHATLNHLLQVFLGQQGFLAAATSLIIRLGHFPEELHLTYKESGICNHIIRYSYNKHAVLVLGAFSYNKYAIFKPQLGEQQTSRAICKAMSVLKFRWASCK